MMSTKRRRLALSYLYYHYLLLIILLLFGSGQAFSHRPRGRPQPREYDHPCCEVIHVTSTSYAEEFHPQHMGAYKIMRNQKNVYRHLSNPRSFIYLLQLPNGKQLLIVSHIFQLPHGVDVLDDLGVEDVLGVDPPQVVQVVP